MQYFFIRIIYGIIQWESVCRHIFPADVWIYYGVPFGVAEIFRGDRRMACSPACGTAHAYADDISAVQASKTVQLFLTERQERLIGVRNYLCLQKIAEKERKYKSD